MHDARKEEEFTRLYQACERDLLGYLLSVVPIHADALDVLQETAGALWRRFDQYDRERPFGAWARQFAHMKVLRYRKSMQRERQRLVLLSDAAVERLTAEFAGHFSVMDLRLGELAGCMEKLLPDDYELAYQRYWENTNLRAVAQQTGISEHRIYRRLQRIRLQLQDCIDAALAERNR